jgi:hypothetical protein
MAADLFLPSPPPPAATAVVTTATTVVGAITIGTTLVARHGGDAAARVARRDSDKPAGAFSAPAGTRDYKNESTAFCESSRGIASYPKAQSRSAVTLNVTRMILTIYYIVDFSG